MKKIFAFLSAIIFVGSSALAVSACGVSQGKEILVEIKGAPTKAENNEDPRAAYVYNQQYVYNAATPIYTLGVAAQLISDKLHDNPGEYNTPDWKELYSSYQWQRDYFSSFNYDIYDISSTTSEAFSYQAVNRAGQDADLIISANPNDFSEDKDIIRFYWFITSTNAGEEPLKSSIIIPSASEFDNDTKVITQNGYIHLFLTIGIFRLDFDAKINFNFAKIVDKQKNELVILTQDSYQFPFGKVDFNNTEKTFNEVIKNLAISKIE